MVWVSRGSTIMSARGVQRSTSQSPVHRIYWTSTWACLSIASRKDVTLEQPETSAL